MASTTQQTVWVGTGSDDSLLHFASKLRQRMDAVIPAACVEIVKDSRGDEPDFGDVADFFALLGAAWVLALLDEPMRPRSHNDDPALQAAMSAFAEWHGVNWHGVVLPESI